MRDLQSANAITAANYDPQPPEPAQSGPAAFKAYVHERLDRMGVPHHPTPEAHEGCRIGCRLDWIERGMASLRDAARRAAEATERADDPANLPSDVLSELWQAIGETDPVREFDCRDYPV